MPVTGMVMTYALDNVTPDSANTGTAWTTGNKTINGTLNVFPDNDDFKYIPTNTTTQQATKQFALNNRSGNCLGQKASAGLTDNWKFTETSISCWKTPIAYSKRWTWMVC